MKCTYKKKISLQITKPNQVFPQSTCPCNLLITYTKNRKSNCRTTNWSNINCSQTNFLGKNLVQPFRQISSKECYRQQMIISTQNRFQHRSQLLHLTQQVLPSNRNLNSTPNPDNKVSSKQLSIQHPRPPQAEKLKTPVQDLTEKTT